MCHILFIHLSIDKHLGWLHFLGPTNRTEISMDMEISLWKTDLESVEYIPKHGAAGSYASLGVSI